MSAMSNPRRASSRTSSRTSSRSWGQRLVILIPYLWLGAFFLVPFLIVFKISLSEYATAQPPYLPQFDLTEGFEGLRDFIAGLSLSGYARLLSDQLYLTSYGRSLGIAFASTAMLLLIGFPIAYGMARAPRRWQGVLFMLIVLPFWTSFLIRVYAWIGLLKANGIVNNLLAALGLVEAPLPLLYNDFAVHLGIVYSYLPFMVLPLYSALEKMDETLLEAASDLGSQPIKAFWQITFPLSLPGVIVT